MDAETRPGRGVGDGRAAVYAVRPRCKVSEKVMMKPQPPAFDPRDVAEKSFTGYPEPFDAANHGRHDRRLGDHAGLRNFGVVLTRITPGGRSSLRHAHARRDEFVYVLEGEAVLETDAGAQVLRAGTCTGFPAGSGDAHCFVNRSSADALLLVVGDRKADDAISYPDIDMQARLGPDGTYRISRKDGTPF
jgi:uncharacterized cupin superfamily protein